MTGRAAMAADAGWAIFVLVSYVAGLLVSCTHAYARRNVRSRGWQLHRGLLGVVLLLCLEAAARVGAAEPDASRAALTVFVVLRSVAAAAWLALLMVIASGKCITRAEIDSEAKPTIVWGPVAYALADGAIGLVLVAKFGRHEEQGAAVVTGGAGLVFALGVFVRVFAWIFVWMFILIAVREEQVNLEQLWARRVRDARDAVQRECESARVNGDEDIDMVSETELDRPMEGELAQAAGPEKAKHRLLRQFNMGVGTFASLLILLIMVPVFEPRAAGACAKLQDALQLCFVFTLAVILRPREASPYLMVESYDTDNIAADASARELVPPARERSADVV